MEATNVKNCKKQIMVLPKELHKYVKKTKNNSDNIESDTINSLEKFLVIKKNEDDFLEFNWEKIKLETSGELDMTEQHKPLSKTLLEPRLEALFQKQLKDYGVGKVCLNKEDNNIIVIKLKK